MPLFLSKINILINDNVICCVSFILSDKNVMKGYNLQDFTPYFSQFSARVEQYRNSRKAIFIGCSVVAMLLVVLLPWYATDLAESLNRMAVSMVGDQWKEHASTSDVISVALVIIAISIFLVLWPIFSYRGSNSSIPRCLCTTESGCA